MILLVKMSPCNKYILCLRWDFSLFVLVNVKEVEEGATMIRNRIFCRPPREV